ncbi:hypothetical protein ABPG73_008271, partial [Tetrahymena malaccensis]
MSKKIICFQQLQNLQNSSLADNTHLEFNLKRVSIDSKFVQQMSLVLIESTNLQTLSINL